MTTKEEMKQEAKALNKHLTDSFLDAMEPGQLLNFTHPLYMSHYREKLRKEAENV